MEANDEIALRLRKIISILEKKSPETTINNEYEDEDVHEKMLLIMNSVDSSLRVALMNKKYNPSTYIKSIREIFNRSTWGRIVELNQQQFNLKMGKNESISTYYDRASIIGDNLKELTGETQKVNIVSNFLNGLPPTYSAAKNSILTKNVSMNDTSINDILEVMYQFESILTLRNGMQYFTYF